MLNKRNSRKVSWTKNISRKERKDAKIFKSLKSIKKRFLNASRTKKNLAALRSWREIYYINYSVTCLFDIAMLEKYLGQK